MAIYKLRGQSSKQYLSESGGAIVKRSKIVSTGRNWNNKSAPITMLEYCWQRAFSTALSSVAGKVPVLVDDAIKEWNWDEDFDLVEFDVFYNEKSVEAVDVDAIKRTAFIKRITQDAVINPLVFTDIVKGKSVNPAAQYMELVWKPSPMTAGEMNAMVRQTTASQGMSRRVKYFTEYSRIIHENVTWMRFDNPADLFLWRLAFTGDILSFDPVDVSGEETILKNACNLIGYSF